MDITPQMEAIIRGLPGAETKPAEGGGMGRIAKNVINLPGNIIEGIASGVVGLAQLGSPGERDVANFPNFFDVPPPQTTGDLVGDFFVGKGGLADTLGQVLAPAGLVGRAGKAAGMAEGKALDALRFGVGTMIPEAAHTDTSSGDVAIAGAFGAGQAPLAYLPMKARMPLSALLAGLHGLYENERRGAFAGGVTAGADFLGGLIGLPGRRPDIPSVSRPQVPEISPDALAIRERPRIFQGEVVEPSGPPIVPRPNVIALPEPRIATLQNSPLQLGSGAALEGPMIPPVVRGLPSPRPDIPMAPNARGIYEPQMPPARPRAVAPLQLEASRNPEATVPVARPQVQSEIKPAQRIKWTPREQAFALDLRKRYEQLDEKELQETITDLDGAIADTLDESSIRSYSLARETAQDSLNARRAPVETESTTAPTKVEKIKRGQRVSYVDEMGDSIHGEVVGFSKTDARIVFDGQSGETTVPRARLKTKEVPQKIATLQKSDVDDVESEGIREGLEQVDEKMKFVDPSEIDKDASKAKGRKEKVVQDDADLHGSFFSKQDPKKPAYSREPPPELAKEAANAAQRIVDAVKNVVNKSLRIFWAKNIGALGEADVMGNVHLNAEEFGDQLRNWHRMSKQDRSKALANLASVVGHEAGHVALNWIRVNDPPLYSQLLAEFKGITPEARHRLMEDYHKMLGINDPYRTGYTAGLETPMAESYGIHPKDFATLQSAGMNEFFAELAGAHIFGKLKESMLPEELRSMWQRVKDVFWKIISSFKPSSWWGAAEALEEEVALNNFKDMLEEVMLRFKKADKAQIDASMNKFMRVRSKEVEGIANKKADFDIEDALERRAVDDTLRYADEFEGMDIVDANTPFGVDELLSFRLRLGGHTVSQLTEELGSALVGGIIGGIAGPNFTDGQVSMSEGILMGGILGGFGPRAIRKLVSVPKSTSATFHHKTFAEALAGVFRGDTEGVAADAATGHGSSVAKFMRFLERNMNLHLPQELFNAVVDADGAAAWALHTIDDAFKKGARNFKESPAFKAATEAYLKGGDLATYKNTVRGLGKEAEMAGQFYIAGREAVATLQTHFAAGLPDGTFKQKILKSLKDGDYLTRQYRIFHDKKYQPTQTQIESVALKYSADSGGAISIDTARQIIENYIHEIKTAGADFRGSVTDVGKKLDSYLWQRRDNLDKTFRDMLGEYHDPREKVLGTIQHLYTSAITGKLIDTVTGLKDATGLNFAYGMEEHSRAVEALQSAIRHGSPPPGKTIATLQKELDTLKAYVPLESNLRHGKLSGKMVSRFVRDQLATFDSPWGLLDGTIMRTMAKFHNAVKIARAPLNPITVVRNIFAMPILTALGGANPLTDIPRAWRAIRGGGAEVREMLENGILNVDAIRGEMLRDVDAVRMLDVDDTITGMVKRGVNKALEFYRWPDMLVRGATYLRAKAKFSKELGLPDTHADVIAKARDWTNRYTVNYANVAPIVKTLRQIPFTNLFISYTAEIVRITKNLVQDAFKHPDSGQRVRAASLLGGLAATPFVAEKFSESQLSEKDRIEWKKARSLMPDYQRTKHLIVMGREKDGRFRYIDMTPLVQIDAFTQMGRALATGDMKAAAAVNPIVSWENTPAINIVAEQITGEDLRSGRPLDKNIITRAKAVIDDIVPPILPGGYEFRRWSEALSSTDQGELGTTNARTGRRTTPGEIVGSYLTGMRIGTVDANKLHQFAIADAKRQLANEAAYLRDVVQTNSTSGVKQKAIARYQQAQKDILLELTQKLQPAQ